MRICCVVGCGNSTYHLNKWMKELCIVHKCNFGTSNCDCEPPFRLYPFPTQAKNPDLRQKWIIKVNRTDPVTKKNWNPKNYDRVCSKHFEGGVYNENSPFPTLNLGHNTSSTVRPSRKEILKYDFVKKSTLKQDTTPLLTQQTPEDIQIYTATPFDQVVKEAVASDHTYIHVNTCSADTKKNNKAENKINIEPHSDHSYAGQCNCTTNCHCEGCFQKQLIINKLTVENEHLKYLCETTNVYKSVHSNFTQKVLRDDHQVRMHTGLPNSDVFDRLYRHLLPKAKLLTYWKGSNKVISTKTQRVFKKPPQKFGPKRKLSVKDELLMTLMKCRLGLNNEFIGDYFSVQPTVVSQVLNTWIKFLAAELKPLIQWPDKIVIKENLPNAYKPFAPNLRCIIDCTEIHIERPRDMELQAQTWSDYKKSNTLKFLVGITPTGSISFLSEAYGGRASDRHIVMDSGFLDLIDPTDEVMADRGFPIQSDLLMRQAKLIIPPPGQGAQQMSKENVKKTKIIANLRIHVERAIGRVKCFQILKNTLPITLVPLANEIFIICSALSNLLPPLVS